MIFLFFQPGKICLLLTCTRKLCKNSLDTTAWPDNGFDIFFDPNYPFFW